MTKASAAVVQPAGQTRNVGCRRRSISHRLQTLCRRSLPAGRWQDTHRRTPPQPPPGRSLPPGGLNLPSMPFHLGQRRAPWLVVLRSMVEYCDGGEGRQPGGISQWGCIDPEEASPDQKIFSQLFSSLLQQETGAAEPLLVEVTHQV